MGINFATMRKYIRDASLTPLEKAVLTDLLLYGGMQEEIFPSEITLGQNHKRTPRQIRNVLYGLRDKGFIKYWYKRGYGKSNLYALNEELFYHNDIDGNGTLRKQDSSNLGNGFPFQTGNEIPPNINKELNNKEDNNTKLDISNQETNFLNGRCSNLKCEQGYIYEGNIARKCEVCNG